MESAEKHWDSLPAFTQRCILLRLAFTNKHKKLKFSELRDITKAEITEALEKNKLVSETS